MSNRQLKQFKRDIKKLVNQTKDQALQVKYGKNLAPSKILKDIEKLAPNKFTWGNRGTNKYSYTRSEKIKIIKSLTPQQKKFVATAVSLGGKHLDRFSSRGRMVLNGKSTYRSGQIGSIALKGKNGGGVGIKTGLIYQKKTNFTPLLSSIRAEFKMEAGPIKYKLQNDALEMYGRIFDKQLKSIRDQEWFKRLSNREKVKYIKENITDPMIEMFRKEMESALDEHVEKVLAKMSYEILKDTIFYYEPSE